MILENDVVVRIAYVDQNKKHSIVFDLNCIGENEQAAFDRDKAYQNLTVEDAKMLRKALKRAIKEAEGE